MEEHFDIQKIHDAKVFSQLDEQDAVALANTGKKQVFVRKFNLWSTLGISVCVSGTWEGITAASAQALNSGGPTALLYGYIAAAVGGLALACSMAELAGAWPTSGALYHWVASLAPGKWRALAGWVTGCLLLGSGWLGVTSAGFGVAIQTQAYVIVSHPNYVPQQWHVTLIFWLTMLIALAINLFSVKLIHYMNITAMGLHIVGYIVIMVVLLACTHPKQSASFVFTNFTNYSGWSNNGIAWCIGLLSSVYGFLGPETAAYYSEEIKNVQRTLPRAIVLCFAVNAILTFPFIISLLFCVGDLEAVLTSPIGAMSPTTQIYINSTGSIAGGIIMNSFSTIIAFVSLTDALGSGARAAFAMSRDGLFPPFFAKVHPRWDVPMNAFIITVTPPMLFGLIYIGNVTAFYGFMSGTLVPMMFLYAVPLGLLLYRRLNNQMPFGPWNLGKFGIVPNVAALGWCSFLTVILALPTMMPVTKENMNYAGVIFISFLIITAATWLFYGRISGYVGPINELEIEGESRGGSVDATHSEPQLKSDVVVN